MVGAVAALTSLLLIAGPGPTAQLRTEQSVPAGWNQGIARIEELIQSMRKKYTILIVTHNMAQARRASDECIFMLLGEIIEHSRTADLFLNPRQPQTERYIGGRYG